MKKYLLILSCVALVGLVGCGSTSVDEEATGPENPENPDKPGPEEPEEPEDDLFEKYLLAHFDTDQDGEISVREADAVTEIDCSDLKIKSLTGIDRFRNLTNLTCKYNSIKTLDLSRNTALTYVDCQVNAITSLNVSGCPMLSTLYCNRNALTALNLASNPQLGHLDCAENRIGTLDVSANQSLSYLDCQTNSLSELWLNWEQEIGILKKDNGITISYRNRPAPLKVGDYYDNGKGVKGVVFVGGNHDGEGKIIALTYKTGMWSKDAFFVGASSETDGAFNMAAAQQQTRFDALYIFKYASEYGEGWYPLAKQEVQAVLDNLAVINETLVARGGEKIDMEELILSSTEISETEVWGCYSYSHNSFDVVWLQRTKTTPYSYYMLFGHKF